MVNTWGYIGLMVVAGALLAFQSPINAALGRSVGIYEASFISFLIGTLVAAVMVFAIGKGDVKAVTGVPLWQLIGGITGLIYVTMIIVSVGEIGVTAVMVAGLVGQMITAMLIDHYGWFGVQPRPLEPTRVMGAVMLGASILMINWKR